MNVMAVYEKVVPPIDRWRVVVKRPVLPPTKVHRAGCKTRLIDRGNAGISHYDHSCDEVVEVITILTITDSHPALTSELRPVHQWHILEGILTLTQCLIVTAKDKDVDVCVSTLYLQLNPIPPETGTLSTTGSSRRGPAEASDTRHRL